MSWWEEPLDVPTATPQDIAAALDNRLTPLGQYLGATAARSFEDSTPGLAVDALSGGRAARDAAGRLDPTHPAATFPLPQPADDDRGLTQDEFKKITGDRPIPFDPYANQSRARALVEAHDRRQWREWLIGQRKAGIVDGTAGFLAGMVASIPDPINFVPIAGPAWRAAVAAKQAGRMAMMLRGAGIGAAEGLVATAAVEPFIVARNRAIGDDTSLAEAAFDILIGGALGGVVGGAGGFLSTRGFSSSAERLSLAMDDLAAGRAVDVGEAASPPISPTPVSRAASIVPPPEPVRPAAARAAPSRPGEQAFLATGEAVPVRYEVVELDSLIASHTDDLAPNPAFPAELQPRDRTRAASAEQIQGIAAGLRPELLGRSATAADGAPIVGPDGVVESGNARTLALRRAYRQGMPGAEGYREFLKREGFDTKGMREPVLIRRRTGELTPGKRAEFARAANERTTAAMGAAERALADAAAIDDRMLSLLQGPDLFAASNRRFTRAFVEKLPQSERGSLVTAGGELSKAGADRVRTALLARAYGDGNLVARLAEEPESGLGPLGQALADVAPDWARMRAEAAVGTIAPEGDGTAGLLDAVRSIVASRDAGNPLHFALTQGDMFGGGLSHDGKAFLTAVLAFDKKGNSRLQGRQKIADFLGRYAGEARKQAPGLSMFGEPPARPFEIIKAVAGVDVGPAPLSDPTPGTPLDDPVEGIKAALAEPEPVEGEDFPELADYEAALAEGRVAEPERKAVEAATAEVRRMAAVEKAYRRAAACVIGALG